MKIALLGPWPAPDGTIEGGVAAVNLALARELAARGADVHVVTLDGADSTAREGSLTVHGVRGQRAFRNLTMAFADVRRLRRAADALDCDVVHAHGLAEYGMAAVGGTHPHVVTVHGLPWDEAPHVRGPIDRARWASLVRRSLACLARARDVTVQTEYARAAVERRSRARLYALANPIDARYCDVAAAEAPAPPFRLLSVARLVPLKRVGDLIDALAALAAAGCDARLLVAGDGDPAEAARLAAQAAARGVAERVEFPGALAPDALLEATARAHLVVHASLQENAPMALEQALAAGRPVVAAGVGGVPSIVRDGDTGVLVAAGRPAAIAQGVRTLLGDPARYRAMSEAARADARRRFHPAVVAEQALRIYDAVLTRR